MQPAENEIILAAKVVSLKYSCLMHIKINHDGTLTCTVKSKNKRLSESVVNILKDVLERNLK